MEEKSFPIIIKKKSSFMITAVVLELVVAAIFMIIKGVFNIVSLLFIFVAVITYFSMLDDLSQLIYLKENKLEVSKRKNVEKIIKYSNVTNLNIKKLKNKRNKIFICINYKNSKKSKNDQGENEYLIDTTIYGMDDLRRIIEMITRRNNDVTISNELKSYIAK